MLWLLALFMTVSFDGTPARCLVDTGASHTVITQDLASHIPSLAKPSFAVQLAAASGAAINGELRTVRSAGTDYLSWKDPSVVVVPDGVLNPGTSCVVGMNLLGQQPVFFDWQTGQLRPIRPELVPLLTAV